MKPMTEKRIKNLYTLNWLVRLTMAFAIGFMAGMFNPETLVLYPAAVVLICAVAKVELHHLNKKYQKQKDKDTKDEQNSKQSNR